MSGVSPNTSHTTGVGENATTGTGVGPWPSPGSDSEPRSVVRRMIFAKIDWYVQFMTDLDMIYAFYDQNMIEMMIESNKLWTDVDMNIKWMCEWMLKERMWMLAWLSVNNEYQKHIEC